MATTTNFGWETPDDTDLVKDGAAAIRTLGSAIDTSLVDLKGGTTGQILSKASNTDMDFTWIANDQGDITAVNVTSPITGGGTAGAVTVGIQDGTTAQKGAVQLENSTSSTSTTTAAVPASVKSAYDLANAAIPKSLVDAKADLITATADNTPARLAVGTNDYVLAAASGESTGLKWKQEGLTLITSTAFSGSATIAVDSVFTSTYANYLIEVVTTSGSGGAAEIQLRFRTSGSANSNASYNNAGSAYSYAAATENTATASGTSAFVMRTNGGQWCGRLNVFNPQATQLTWWLGQFADSAQTGYRGGYFNATTSFDGFQLVNSGATNVAGTIRVYGMAN